MDTEVQNKVISMLDQMAEKLGQGTEYAWPHLVRATVIEGWAGIVGAVILFIICCIAWAVLLVQYKKVDEFTDSPGLFIGGFFLCLFTMFVIMKCTLGVEFDIQRIIEPEGYLLMKMIESAK